MNKEDADTHALLRELLADPLLKDVADCLPFREYVPIEELKSDSELNSLPPLDADMISALLAETECMVQAELGGACRIKLEREGHEPQNIVIKLDATVKDLKKIIQQKIDKASRMNTQRLRRAAIENEKRIDHTDVPGNGVQVKDFEDVSMTGDSDPRSDVDSNEAVDNMNEDVDATEPSVSTDLSDHVISPRYTSINWKYIWKSNCLKLDDARLLEDDKAQMKEWITGSKTVEVGEVEEEEEEEEEEEGFHNKDGQCIGQSCVRKEENNNARSVSCDVSALIGRSQKLNTVSEYQNRKG
ncbi:hypothetical protein BGX26_009755 [Mortierella sp. AD094]|nr:hypothetical protein BGX26_009755 [Mortierella sp. AD094]